MLHDSVTINDITQNGDLTWTKSGTSYRSNSKAKNGITSTFTYLFKNNTDNKSFVFDYLTYTANAGYFLVKYYNNAIIDTNGVTLDNGVYITYSNMKTANTFVSTGNKNSANKPFSVKVENNENWQAVVLELVSTGSSAPQLRALNARIESDSYVNTFSNWSTTTSVLENRTIGNGEIFINKNKANTSDFYVNYLGYEIDTLTCEALSGNNPAFDADGNLVISKDLTEDDTFYIKSNGELIDTINLVCFDNQSAVDSINNNTTQLPITITNEQNSYNGVTYAWERVSASKAGYEDLSASVIKSTYDSTVAKGSTNITIQINNTSDKKVFLLFDYKVSCYYASWSESDCNGMIVSSGSSLDNLVALNSLLDPGMSGTSNKWGTYSVPINIGVNYITIQYRINYTTTVLSGDNCVYLANLVLVEVPNVNVSLSYTDNQTSVNFDDYVVNSQISSSFTKIPHNVVDNYNRVYTIGAEFSEPNNEWTLQTYVNDVLYTGPVSNIKKSMQIKVVATQNATGASGVAIEAYPLDFVIDLTSLYDETTAEYITSITNDKFESWTWDGEYSTEEYDVFNCSNKNENEDGYFEFDVDIPNDGKAYYISFEYLAQFTASSGSVRIYTYLDGSTYSFNNKTYLYEGTSQSDWSLASASLPSGKHTVRISEYLYTGNPLEENLARIRNLSIRPLILPDIELMDTVGSLGELIKNTIINEGPIYIDFWSHNGIVNEEYKLVVENIQSGYNVYAMANDGIKYYEENGIIIIPDEAVENNIIVFVELSDGSVFRICEANLEIYYDPAKLFNSNNVTASYEDYNNLVSFNYITSFTDKNQITKDGVIYAYCATGAKGITINYNVNLDNDSIFSFDYLTHLDEFGIRFGAFKLYLDDAEIVNFIDIDTYESIVWETGVAIIPAGQHQLSFYIDVYLFDSNFDVNNLPYGWVLLSNMKFSQIVSTGSGTNADPFVAEGLSSLNDFGLLNDYTHLFTLTDKTTDVYFNFDDMTITEVSISSKPEGAITSVELVEGKAHIIDMAYSGSVYINVTTNVGSFMVEIRASGIPGYDEITGNGSEENPFVISKAEHLELLNTYNNRHFILNDNIDLTGVDFTPIGSASAPFIGGFDGGDYTISGLDLTGTDYLGLFGYAESGYIKNLNIQGSVSGSSYIGGLVGYANKLTITNVHVDATIKGTNQMIGGIIGYAGTSVIVSQASFVGTIEGGVKVGGLVGEALAGGNSKFIDCTVGTSVNNTTIIQTSTTNQVNNIGGLSGNGGDFENCIMYATVSGSRIVGGLVGGYSNTSNFTNSYMAGTVISNGVHSLNYPYWGTVNGYGAWVYFKLTNTGIQITLNYTSSVDVTDIIITNCDKGYELINSSEKDGVYTRVYQARFGETAASTGLLSETLINGITGNYGGVGIKFVMADGTYKYLTTLDRVAGRIVSNFDVNLDELTSYEDNFANISIATNIGTSHYYVDEGISIFGTALVDNANDFEHLSWCVNNGIAVTFADGLYYNERSIATLSIKLMDDIDLTSDRVNNDGVYLNRVGGVSTGDKINQFYGFGTSEMNPYRGSLYGNNHSLTVDINMPGGYGVGIFAFSSEMSYPITISDLTILGNITGQRRVGIVGLFDSYYRQTSLQFTNVVNKANITAVDGVGAFVGYIQGSNDQAQKYLIFNNCTNYGIVTGSSDTFKYSQTIGGFVGCVKNDGAYIANCTFKGANNNYGAVIGANAQYFVGNWNSRCLLDSGATLNLYYTLDLSKPNVSVTINGEKYISDENGLIYVNMGNIKTFSALNNINYTDDKVLGNLVAVVNEDLLTTIKVVEDLSIDESSVLSTDTNSGWTIKVKVTYTDGSTEVIDANYILSDELINGIDFELNNVVITNDEYDLSGLTVDLSRVPTVVSEYVASFNALKNETVTANLKSKAQDLISKYNALTTAYASASEANTTKLNEYLTANNATEALKNAQLKEIVDSVNTASLNNVSITYGTFEFSKNIIFTMMDGSSVTKSVNYTFEKNGTLSAVATTEGVTLMRANGVVAYVFNEDCNVTITPIAISNINITSKEVTYNGKAQTLDATFTVLEGDVVTAVLSYNGESDAINAGVYDVKIESLSGADSIYYTIPTHTSRTLTINKLGVYLTTDYTSAYTYTGEVQKPTANVTNNNGYTFVEGDYTISYSNAESKNADTYTITLQVNDNFVIRSADKIEYTINPLQLTTFAVTNDLIYDKTEKALIFDISGVIGEDVVNVSSYTVYNSHGQTTDAINAGDYYAIITGLDNKNYTVNNARVDFEVKPINIEVTLSAQSSIYGDEIVVSNTAYSVTDGAVVDDDDLGITISKANGSNADEYELTATYSNTNYNVTFVNGTYTINAREVAIDWSNVDELNLIFNNQNQISSVIMPTINNVVTGENDLFEFSIFQNDNITSEVKYAGQYTIKLTNELELTNYVITNETEKVFEVGKYLATITVSDKTSGYLVQDTNFENTVVLPNGIVLSDLGDIEYTIYDDAEVVSGTLEVGNYTIKAELNNLTALANNFDFEFVDGTYNITASELNIVGSQLTTTYNAKPVTFEATVEGSDGPVEVELKLTYYQGETELDSAPVNAGTYRVVVSNTNENYDIADAEFTIVINPNKITLDIVADNKTYDRTSVNVSVSASAEAGLLGDDYIKYIVTKAGEEVEEFISAGTYKVIVSLLDTTNFEFANASEKEFTISKADVTITLLAQNSTFGETINVDSTKYEITNGSVYQGDDLGVVITKANGTDAGIYTLEATTSNSNYNVTVVNGQYTINRKNIELEYTGLDNLTYTGAELTNLIALNMTGLDGIVEYWYTDSNKQQISKPINAGDYYIRVHLIDDNYTIGSGDTIDRAFKINKINWDIIINLTNKTYDGNAFAIDNVMVNDDIVDAGLYVLTFFSGDSKLNSSPSDAGTYTVQVTPKDTVNYQFEASQEFTIDKKTIEIQFTDYELTYNKQVQQANAIVKNKVNNDDVSLQVSYTGEGFINAGDYSIMVTGITGEDKDNYQLPTSGLSLDYTIDQLVVNVEFKNTIFDYSGTRLLASDLGISFDSEYVAQSDYTLSELPLDVVADYDVTVNSINDNIIISNNTIAITINPVDITGIYLADGTFKFDGREKSLSVNTLTLPDGNTASVTYENNNQTEKGVYTVKAEVSNKNYNTLTLQAKLTIETNVLTVVYSGGDVYYNKQAQGVNINTDNLTDGVKELLEVRYVGVNVDYDSTEKPINAGTYKIVVSSENTDNVQITNPEKEFKINPRPVTFVNLSTQTVTYDSNAKVYNVTASGIIDGDDVIVELTYNGEAQAINAGTYTVAIVGLTGDSADNYTITSGLTASLVINPTVINVVAEDKVITYGDSNVALTYKADPLFGDDEFSGELTRQAGNTVNTYDILQGTLTAGDNYNIVFTGATYTINSRVLTVELTQDEYTYRGSAIEPQINVGNIVNNESNVYSIQIIGDNVNAGTFKAKVNILNSNYSLPSNYADFTITINKQDVSDKILRLVNTSAAYTGEVITPIAFIENVDDVVLDYSLTITLNNQAVENIINVGNYKVTVNIVSDNYTGSKEFDFVVTSVEPDDVQLVITANSNSITVEPIANAEYKLNDGEYQSSNVFTGLDEMTRYTITVKILASGNYTEKVLTPVEVSTTLAPATLNADIESIGEFDITKLQAIKDAYADLAKVSEDELTSVNTSALEALVSAYESYLDKVALDLDDARDVASASISEFGVGIFVSSIVALMTLLFVMRLRKI